MGLGGNPNPGLRGISPNVPSLRSLRRNCDDLFLVWPLGLVLDDGGAAAAALDCNCNTESACDRDVEGGDGLLLRLRVIPDDRLLLLLLLLR